MDLELQKEMFADHIATLKDYGDIKVLDFQKPESNYYRIRFIFEEDHDRVHISGDLGELIAYNHAGLNFRNFIDYCRRGPALFKVWTRCSSQPLYTYDRELAEKHLLQKTKDNYTLDRIADYFDVCEPEDAVEPFIEKVLDGFSDTEGICEIGERTLLNIDYSAFDPIDEIGLEEGPDIFDVYLLAFKLAYRQLQEKGVVK
ncbi:hypothetical protein [Catenibacterium mitsuokai]|jgi:hypothetical protein|uniref:hypothetical protein n=1 Tax=Catenibacterium mitsuokai TaxID=100886 RepID=UPI00319D9665